jgi:TolB-like protein
MLQIAGIPSATASSLRALPPSRSGEVDAKAIGKDSGVRAKPEGSVQPSGAQVRVNAQLIDTDSSAHFWAEQFDTTRA